MDVKKTQRGPFKFFGIETFFKKKFPPKRPPFNIFLICNRMDEKSQSIPLARQFAPTFEIFRFCRREYFDSLRSPFAISEP